MKRGRKKGGKNTPKEKTISLNKNLEKDYWKDKKVLVAGGSGFIGINLVKKLLLKGAEVTATYLMHHPKDVLSDFDPDKQLILESPNVSWRHANLENEEDCDLVTRHKDYVFMCAAVTHGAAFMEKNPMALVTPNLIMNAKMTEAAYFHRVKKFVFISSSAAYPDTQKVPTREDHMSKGEPYDKYYPVAWMKRYSEILCKTYSTKIKNPMATLIIRPSNLFGPYDDYNPETSHVTAALIKKVAERQKPVELWGDGEDLRDIMYINTFIDILLHVSELSGIYDEVNIATSYIFKVIDILHLLISNCSFYNPPIKLNKDKPSMIPIRKMNTGRLKTKYGYESKLKVMKLVRNLKNTLEWYEKNKMKGLSNDHYPNSI